MQKEFDQLYLLAIVFIGFSGKPDLCGEMEVQVMTFYLTAMGLQHGGQSPQLDRWVNYETRTAY